MAYPEPVEVAPWYLRNITQALELDSVTGQVHVRSSIVGGDIAEQSFINSSNQSSSAPTQEAFTFEYQLERDPFTGVAYEYVIMMATTGTNMDVYASLEWQEIT